LADRPDRGARGSEPSQPAQSPREKSAWWDIPLTIGIAVGVVLLITTFLAKPFSIPSGSMEETLGIGDRVLVNRAVYHLRDIERGDVVVFDGSDSFVPAGDAPERNPVAAVLAWAGQSIGLVPPDSTDFIKRVIGVGGDRVTCCDAEGRLTVNGVPLDEAAYLYPGDSPSTQDVRVWSCRRAMLWVYRASHRSNVGGLARSRSGGSREVASCPSPRSSDGPWRSCGRSRDCSRSRSPRRSRPCRPRRTVPDGRVRA